MKMVLLENKFTVKKENYQYYFEEETD